MMGRAARGHIFLLPPLTIYNRHLSSLLGLLSLLPLRYNQAQDAILHASSDSLLDNWLWEGESTAEVSYQTLREKNRVL